MRESEKYYNVPNWILYIGGGFTPRTGILAIIYSFCKDADGNLTGQCKAGIDYFVKQVGCSRREVFRQLENLCKAGYIKRLAKRNKAQTAFFIMIAERCEQAKQAYDAQSQADGAAYDAQSQADGAAYDTQSQESNAQEPSCATVAHEDAAQEPESARAHDTAAFSPIPNHEEIKLTAEQQRELQREVTGTGRSLESYFRSLEKSMKSNGKSYEPHYETLRDWMQRDKDKAEQQRKAKGQSSNSSSIDNADLAKLDKTMPGRGACTG